MRLATYEGESDVEEVAARVYDLGKRPAATTVAEATRTLLEANPALAALRDLTAGTAILVPPIRDVAPARDQGLAQRALDEALDEIRRAVETLREREAKGAQALSQQGKTVAAALAGVGKRDTASRAREVFDKRRLGDKGVQQARDSVLDDVLADLERLREELA